MIRPIRELSLLDILPDNLLRDKQIEATAKALDSELQKVTEAVQETLLLSRLDDLPEQVLDLLAWQWHVDFYEPIELDADTKRKLIRQSIAWHYIKGTPGAVEKAVSAVFGHATVKEWFEYGGEPYRFRISVEGRDAFDEGRDIRQFNEIVGSVKNVRSWLDSIDIHASPQPELEENQLKIFTGIGSQSQGKHSIHRLEPPDESEMLAYSATGFHRQGRHAITIGPAELSVETPLFSGLATFRAGKIRIPADLSELPQDIWDILTDSVVEGFAGIGRYSCGKHAIGIQLPEDGGAALAYGVGTARIGIKRTGIEVSSGTEKDVRYGLGTSRTGRISIYADLGDIPPSHMPSSHVGLIHVGVGHIGCSKGGK